MAEEQVEEQVLDEGADFEEHRRYLSSVAYRLLGSLADAEDAVQEAWLRWRSTDRAAVKEPRAFLTTVVTRICYDQLGSARMRREAYYGEWLPEPAVGGTGGGAVVGGGGAGEQDPQELATFGESVSYAVLAVMEQLGPAERVAFVLHDVFAVGFEEIAAALGRSVESTRQLASRGRRRIRDGTKQQTLDRAEHRKAVAAFAAAAVKGDIPALMAVLDPDVVWHSDGGGIVRAGLHPVVTADLVSKLVGGFMARWVSPEVGLRMEEVDVNGAPGLAAFDGSGASMGVMAFEVVDGRIATAYAVINPEKLVRVAEDGAVSRYLPRR